SSRRRHTRFSRDWSSDVCSSDLVELHGTGTPVGDPVEATALGDALGVGRPQDDPLRVGSIKTNIGHLEGAAGIAGLLKVVLSIEIGRASCRERGWESVVDVGLTD